MKRNSDREHSFVIIVLPEDPVDEKAGMSKATKPFVHRMCIPHDKIKKYRIKYERLKFKE